MRRLSTYSFIFLLAISLGSGLIGNVLAQNAEELKPLDLDETAWEVTIVVTGQRKAKNTAATLVFADEKFTSQGSLGTGYEPTNYTLDVREDGTTTFKTIQTKAKETTFWQGEVLEHSKTIQGTIGVNSEKGGVQNYVFAGPMLRGVLKPPKNVPPLVPDVVEPSAPSVADPAAVK